MSERVFTLEKSRFDFTRLINSGFSTIQQRSRVKKCVNWFHRETSFINFTGCVVTWPTLRLAKLRPSPVATNERNSPADR